MFLWFSPPVLTCALTRPGPEQRLGAGAGRCMPGRPVRRMLCRPCSCAGRRHSLLGVCPLTGIVAPTLRPRGGRGAPAVWAELQSRVPGLRKRPTPVRPHLPAVEGGDASATEHICGSADSTGDSEYRDRGVGARWAARPRAPAAWPRAVGRAVQLGGRRGDAGDRSPCRQSATRPHRSRKARAVSPLPRGQAPRPGPTQ